MYMKKWPRPGKEPSERIRVKIASLSPGWKLFLPTKLGKLITHRVGVLRKSCLLENNRQVVL